jgi:hypothetical protein
MTMSELDQIQQLQQVTGNMANWLIIIGFVCVALFAIMLSIAIPMDADLKKLTKRVEALENTNPIQEPLPESDPFPYTDPAAGDLTGAEALLAIRNYKRWAKSFEKEHGPFDGDEKEIWELTQQRRIAQIIARFKTAMEDAA